MFRHQQQCNHNNTKNNHDTGWHQLFGFRKPFDKVAGE
jgi:hypothetical protein